MYPLRSFRSIRRLTCMMFLAAATLASCALPTKGDYSHFSPLGEYLSKTQFANYLPTLGLAEWHYTQSVKTRSGEGQTASIDRAMSRTLPFQVEGHARQCKILQGCGRSAKSFLVNLRGA
jgi:hypothetical protein